MQYYVTPQDYESAEKLGISKENVYQRVHVYNWPVERAISQPLCKVNAYGWKEHKHIAKENGIPYRTYLNRVTAGWSQEAAASTPSLSYKERGLRMAKAKENKRTFTDEQIARAKANGVCHRKLWARVKILGWDIEVAINTPKLSPEETQRRAHLANHTFRNLQDAYWAEAKNKGMQKGRRTNSALPL
ncbi:MAG: hypothetical protein K0S25_33 [Bacillus sp. (in: firmicutes)]|jgi:hypothetical protein|nr:hypothetical protein [Bacillus sp. (in: firmicutes)]